MERQSFGAGLRCRTQARSLRILPAFSASPCTKSPCRTGHHLAIRKFLSRTTLIVRFGITLREGNTKPAEAAQKPDDGTDANSPAPGEMSAEPRGDHWGEQA